MEQFILHYGYFAIFGLLMLGIVGPLIPDETILVVAGIAIRSGQLDPVITLIAAYAGSVFGVTLSYTLGRTGVSYLLHKIPYLERANAKHMGQVHDWFERFGRWTLFFGYFVVGVRHVTALVAGTSKMRPDHFALYAYTGGFIWVVCFLAIGYFVGNAWEQYARQFHGVVAAVAIAVAVCVFVGYRWHKGRQRP